MGTNYERFLHIISKWPTEISRPSLDYGLHLKSLLKNKDIYGNVFSGNSVENAKILDSLSRLLNNAHKNRYPCTINRGASKIDEMHAKDILNSNITRGGPKK